MSERDSLKFPKIILQYPFLTFFIFEELLINDLLSFINSDHIALPFLEFYV